MGNTDWETRTIARLEGECGQTRLVLTNAPFRYSPSRNAWQLLELRADDFHVWMLVAIEEQLFCTTKANVFGFRARRLCRGCGANLELSALQVETLRVQIGSDEVPAFEVELHTPTVKCPACARVQAVQGTQNDDLIEAQTAIFLQLDVMS